MKKSSYNHLSLNQRYLIEMFLNQNFKLKDIANEINKDPRGVSKEIKRNRYLHVRSNAKNKCGIQNTCLITRLCDNCVSGKCKYCSFAKCSSICEYFIDEPQCKRVMKFPFVCNGCEKLKECSLPKLFYKADKAQFSYETNISSWKCGTRLSATQLAKLDIILSNGIKNGHSLDIIIHNNNLSISLSTLYRLIDLNYFSIKNIDLKRKVVYKERYTNKPKAKPLDYNYLENRRFSDYCIYISEHLDVNVWQMDTIVGAKGAHEEVILSLLHTKSNLQLFFKMKSNTRSEVNRTLDNIKSFLGDDLFKEIFAVVLTDNGGEFKDPLSMECNPLTGEVLIKVFYCEPRRSDQKGKCEKNHVHFRECIPKGVSINTFSDMNINYISNQINNYPRKSLNYNTPLNVALVMINKKVFKLNELSFLDPKTVVLKHLK